MARAVISLVLALQVMLAGVPVRFTFGGRSAPEKADGCCAAVTVKSCCVGKTKPCCCGPTHEKPVAPQPGAPAMSACPCGGEPAVVVQHVPVFVCEPSVSAETPVLTVRAPVADIAPASHLLPLEPPPPRAAA